MNGKLKSLHSDQPSISNEIKEKEKNCNSKKIIYTPEREKLDKANEEFDALKLSLGENVGWTDFITKLESLNKNTIEKLWFENYSPLQREFVGQYNKKSVELAQKIKELYVVVNDLLSSSKSESIKIKERNELILELENVEELHKWALGNSKIAMDELKEKTELYLTNVAEINKLSDEIKNSQYYASNELRDYLQIEQNIKVVEDSGKESKEEYDKACLALEDIKDNEVKNKENIDKTETMISQINDEIVEKNTEISKECD